MKNKKQNGITLVALVVTIVAMLILAGITINLTVSEDGIITKAQEAGEKQKIAEHKEEIELTKIDVETENLGEITLDKLINKLYEKKVIPEGSAKMLDDGKSAQITTPDGYIFIITIDRTDYIGKGDKIEAPPDLQEGDVTFSLDSITWTEQNKNTWTKENVTVTIKTKEEIGSGFTLQYSLDGSNWTKYTNPFVVKQNTTVYACLTNIMDQQGQYATADITVIDKLPPVEFTPRVTATTNSVTIDASGAEDAESTSQYGQSGIGEIWYKLDDEEWVTNTDKTQTSYTYDNLTQNTSYTAQVKVIDNAGNEKESASQQVSTTEVTGIQTGDVTFSYSPSGATKENVAVTISGNNTGYTLQYKTEKTGASGEVTDWTNYEGAITLTRNQDIYARVVDSTGQYANTTATGTVANIDKLAPNSFTPTASSTTNSITVTASATDQAKTSDNASSGIAGYSFSKDNGLIWTAYQESGTYTFDNFTESTYSIGVKAIDKANNETTVFITKYEEKLVNLNYEMNATNIATINGISKDEISNIIVKNSSGNIVSNVLNGYDIYSLSFNYSQGIANQTIITKPSTSKTITNALENGGFESEISNYYNGTPLRSTSIKRNGNYSMYYTCTNSQAFLRIKYGDIGAQNNKIYLRIYAMTNSDTLTPGIYVYETETNANWSATGGRVTAWMNNQKAYNNWEKLSLIASPSSKNYSYFMLQIAQANGNGNGEVYWDDFMAIVLDNSWETEPTVKWLDKMIPDFTGTKTLSW